MHCGDDDDVACEKLLRKFLVRDPAKRPSLDAILDDPWLNEGYESHPLNKQSPEDLVTEDTLVLNIMESKFSVEKDHIIKGLKNNVYDDIMAIYFLLYNEKRRNGEGAVIKISEQMATKALHHGHTSATNTPDIARTGTPNGTVTAPVSTIKEEGGAVDSPAAIRSVTVPRKSRRSTTSEEPNKTADAQTDEATRKLKEMQVKDGDKVVPRSRTDAPRPRPVSVAVPSESYVPAPISSPIVPPSAEKKEKANEATDSGTHIGSTDEEVSGSRRRTNTIAGFLKIRTRATNGTSTATGTPVDSPTMESGSIDTSNEESTKNLGFGPDVKPRSLRFTFNSNTTSSKAPDDIVQDVMNTCQKLNLKAKLLGRYLIECAAPPPTALPGAEEVKIEIEVCKLPRLRNLHGLRFKRVGGSSADYKTISEQILGAIQL